MTHQPATTPPALDGPSARALTTERILTLWVPTEELWRDLETTTGVGLGRYKSWNADGPRHFDSKEYDVDVMVDWARTHEIPYTEQRALHHPGRAGTVDLATGRLTPACNPAAAVARLRAFEAAAREFLCHPPSEWTVERGRGREWKVVDHRGATIARRTTKRDALAAIGESAERRTWEDNRAWYLGEHTDPHVRSLTVVERSIVAAILAESADLERSGTDTAPTSGSRETRT